MKKQVMQELPEWLVLPVIILHAANLCYQSQAVK
jgi:hypothetical protein